MSGWTFPEFVNGFKRKIRTYTESTSKKKPGFFTLKTSAQVEQEERARQDAEKEKLNTVEFHIKERFGYHFAQALLGVELEALVPQEFKDFVNNAPIKSIDVTPRHITLGVKLGESLEIGMRITSEFIFFKGQHIINPVVPHDIYYKIEYHYKNHESEYRSSVGPTTYEELIEAEMPEWFRNHLDAEFT